MFSGWPTGRRAAFSLCQTACYYKTLAMNSLRVSSYYLQFQQPIRVFIFGISDECHVTSVPWKVLRALSTISVSPQQKQAVCDSKIDNNHSLFYVL
jgi:hypothetical protein